MSLTPALLTFLGVDVMDTGQSLRPGDGQSDRPARDYVPTVQKEEGPTDEQTGKRVAGDNNPKKKELCCGGRMDHLLIPLTLLLLPSLLLPTQNSVTLGSSRSEGKLFQNKNSPKWIVEVGFDSVINLSSWEYNLRIRSAHFPELFQCSAGCTVCLQHVVHVKYTI